MENKVFEVKIKMLAPIWTGGVENECDRLHETGIIGSLRWWHEAVVRGLGGYACDPTDKDKRCELSGKEKTDEERRKNMCPVCYLFGCGGWKRRFRLEVKHKGEFVPFQLATLDKKDNFNYWWLSQIFANSINSQLPFGDIILKFTLLNDDGIEKQLKSLLSIMSHLGAIGAKTQYGFGQFDFEEKMRLENSINTIRDFLKANNFKQDTNNDKWYSLEKFWFYKIQLPSENKLIKKFQRANIVGSDTSQNNYLPVSFDIRYKLPGSDDSGLRQSYYNLLNGDKNIKKQKTKELFGMLGNEKIGGRIFVSHLFKREEEDDNYILRVWGFTEENVGVIIGKELKKMFGFEDAPYMKKGTDILKDIGGENNE